MDGAAQEAVGEGGGAVAGVEDKQRRGFRPVPGGVQPSTFFTWAIVWAVRVAGTVRATSTSAAHAVRRCPIAAVNWYSQPGAVLDEPRQ